MRLQEVAQNSNTVLSHSEEGKMLHTLKDMVQSLQGSLSKGLLKTKINEIALLAEHIPTNENSVEELKHLKKKIKLGVQLLSNVFLEQKDPILTPFWPTLVELKEALGISRHSASEKRIPSHNKEPMRSHHQDEPQGQSKTSNRTRRKSSKKTCDKPLDSQFKIRLRLLIRSLQALINKEKRQIKTIILTEELDVLTKMKAIEDKISKHDRSMLLRTLDNLKKHSPAIMLENINKIKQLLEGPPKDLLDRTDHNKSLDPASSERTKVEDKLLPFETSTSLPPKQASPKEAMSCKSQTSEEKCLVQDVNKQNQQPLNHQMLPDLVVTTLQDGGANKHTASSATQSVADLEDQYIRKVRALLEQVRDCMTK